MDDDRLTLWLGFAKFVLGTVVLGLVSTVVSHQIQNREVEIREQEMTGTFLEHAIDQDVGVRRRFAQYFATVTRSDARRARWQAYFEVVEAEYQATAEEKATLEATVQTETLSVQERDRLNREIARLDRALDPRGDRGDERVLPRVFVHIRTEAQRAQAQQLAAMFRENALPVPGIERLGVGPERTEVRYFRAAETEEAEAIVDLLQAEGVTARAVYVPGYEASTDVRPRTFEVWMAPPGAE